MDGLRSFSATSSRSWEIGYQFCLSRDRRQGDHAQWCRCRPSSAKSWVRPLGQVQTWEAILSRPLPWFSSTKMVSKPDGVCWSQAVVLPLKAQISSCLFPLEPLTWLGASCSEVYQTTSWTRRRSWKSLAARNWANSTTQPNCFAKEYQSVGFCVLSCNLFLKSLRT